VPVHVTVLKWRDDALQRRSGRTPDSIANSLRPCCETSHQAFKSVTYDAKLQGRLGCASSTSEQSHVTKVMSDETYYAALGVAETATPSEIKAAYRNLLKKIHPDTVSTLSPNVKRIAQDATQEIIEAYSVLSNEDRRRQYDQQLVDSRRQAAAASSVPAPRGPAPGIPGRVATKRTRTRHSRVHFCRKCGARKEANGSCPKCGSARRWASRHPILTVFLLAVVLPAILILCAVVVMAIVESSPAS
jgi:rubrerythrin